MAVRNEPRRSRSNMFLSPEPDLPHRSRSVPQMHAVGLYQCCSNPVPSQPRRSASHVQIHVAGPDPPCRCVKIFLHILTDCSFITSPTSLGLLTYDRSAPHFLHSYRSAPQIRPTPQIQPTRIM